MKRRATRGTKAHKSQAPANQITAFGSDMQRHSDALSGCGLQGPAFGFGLQGPACTRTFGIRATGASYTYNGNIIVGRPPTKGTSKQKAHHKDALKRQNKREGGSGPR